MSEKIVKYPEANSLVDQCEWPGSERASPGVVMSLGSPPIQIAISLDNRRLLLHTVCLSIHYIPRLIRQINILLVTRVMARDLYIHCCLLGK